jgi:hypothetical protein
MATITTQHQFVGKIVQLRGYNRCVRVVYQYLDVDGESVVQDEMENDYLVSDIIRVFQ